MKVSATLNKKDNLSQSFIISGSIIHYSILSEWPSSLKGVQYAKATSAFAMPLPKQPRRQSHGASPVHVVPTCLWTFTCSSSGTEPELAFSHLSPHNIACSFEWQNEALSRREKRGQQGINRYMHQYEENWLMVLRALKNTHDDSRSSLTGEAENLKLAWICQ